MKNTSSGRTDARHDTAQDANPGAPSDSVTKSAPSINGLGRLVRRPGLVLALGVAGGLLLAATAGGILSSARGLVINVVVALFLSFGLEPAVKWLADRGWRRGWATGLVFLVGFLGFVGFVAAMLPLIIDQTTNLVDNAQNLVDGLANNAASLPGSLGGSVSDALTKFQDELPQRMPEFTQTATRGALNIGASVVGTIFNVLTIALVTFYMTADAPKMRAVLASRLGPQRQRELLQVWDLAIDKTGGYVYSRVLTLVASTLFHVAAFWLIGLEYAVALGAWVGIVSSLIPVVGTYLAGVLPVLVALAGSPADVVWVLVALTIYQAAENYLIAPRITAHTLSLHPAVTFVSVLLGASLLGAVGALLAIPATAIVAALISANAEVHPHPDEPDEDEAPAADEPTRVAPDAVAGTDGSATSG